MDKTDRIVLSNTENDHDYVFFDDDGSQKSEDYIYESPVEFYQPPSSILRLFNDANHTVPKTKIPG